MTSLLQRIRIQNFKAFREFALAPEGRHILVYGPNGSGKSSLYWALYTFLQSARKPTRSVSKYFDPADPQNLLNIHEDSAAKAGEIALTLVENGTSSEKTYRISHTLHETKQEPVILKGDLASDFVTYRFFFGFSHFRNSETFDVWPLFEKEILPFCVSTSGVSPLDMWLRIRSGQPNPTASRGVGGAKAYESFKKRTDEFASILPGIVDSISVEAQKFYATHFSKDDAATVTLKLGVTTLPSFEGTNHDNCRFIPPVVEFGVKIAGKTIARPQSFLNEAKLTQFALSVRFAASIVNLHESDLKLLVLDDLLVSLDMSNRMQVVDILLSDTFSSYQKVILTHELGFFREVRRKLGASHPDWCFLCLRGKSDGNIEAKNEKTSIQKAEDYLCGHNLEEAALCLRKAAEDTARRFLDRDGAVEPSKEFKGLQENLRAARNKILAELPVDLYRRVLKQTPALHLSLLVASTDDDIASNAMLDPITKGQLRCQRKRLRQLISAEHKERLRQVDLIDEIIACTERVLNPLMHAGDPPLYEAEVANALDLVRSLENTLT